MTEPWFSISGDEILAALRDVAGGTSPETAYAKLKSNSQRTKTWGPDSPGYDEMGQ